MKVSILNLWLQANQLSYRTKDLIATFCINISQSIDVDIWKTDTHFSTPQLSQCITISQMSLNTFVYRQTTESMRIKNNIT